MNKTISTYSFPVTWTFVNSAVRRYGIVFLSSVRHGTISLTRQT